MARRRKKAAGLSEDERISQLFGNVKTKYGGMGREDFDSICAGLPVPYYSERFIRDSNVYITGKIEMYVGNQGSGKSSYGFHVANTFLDHRGLFFLVETENKMSPVSLRANIGDERYNSGRVQMIPCGSVDMESKGDDEDNHLQSWQEAVSGIIANLRANDLTHLPVYILIDSLLGASGAESRKEYTEEGRNSGRSTSDMARAAAITRFLSNLAPDLRDTNILVGITNHGKTKINMGGFGGGGDDRAVPGGDAIGFHCSTILWFERGAKESDSKTTGRRVKISCYKNSFGDDSRKLTVGFRYDHIRDDDGNPLFTEDNEYLRTVQWNWHEATALLLKDYCAKDNFNDRLSCAESRKLITLHTAKSKFSCEELNLTDATAEEFGAAFEQHPDVDLRVRAFPKLGVCQFPVIEFETQE